MKQLTGIYPVLTLYQPWATWIMRKWKPIETRTHNRFNCLLNKTILIHAGKTTDTSDAAIKNKYLTKEQLLFNPEEMINGFILGSAFVANTRCLISLDSKNALIECDTQRYGLDLNEVNKFEIPIPEKGEMGIWYYDMDNMCKVKKPKPKTLKLF